MKLGRSLVTILILTSLIGFIGCDLINPSNSDNVLTGSLYISVEESISRNLITPSIDLDIDHYTISGIGPDERYFPEFNLFGQAKIIDDLFAGLWTITIDAKNSEDLIIGSATVEVEIIANEKVSSIVDVSLLDGWGTLSLDLSWPVGYVINPILDGQVESSEGSVTSLDFNIVDNLATVDISLEEGYYTLTLQFYDGEELLWGTTKTVLIMKDQITSGAEALEVGSLDILTGDLSMIISQLVTPDFSIQIDGPERIYPGSDVTLEAVIVYDSTYIKRDLVFEWYIQGARITDASEASLTLGGDLPLGLYNITVIAKADDIRNSKSVEMPVAYIVGDRGPANGNIVYVDDENVFDWTYMESYKTRTTDATYPLAQWGSSGSLIGGTQTGIGTGEANTQLINSVLEQRGETNRASQKAATFSVTFNEIIYDDWFLPSKDELAIYIDNFFESNDEYFYTSSEYDATSVWVDSDNPSRPLQQLAKDYYRDTQIMPFRTF